MKFEIKAIIIGIVFSLCFMVVFTYIATFGMKTYYVYQVGIYKEEVNKNEKLSELESQGIKGYFYIKDNQYYVLSMISENESQIKEHASSIKGIIKNYTVSQSLTNEELLNVLSKGE